MRKPSAAVAYRTVGSSSIVQEYSDEVTRKGALTSSGWEHESEPRAKASIDGSVTSSPRIHQAVQGSIEVLGLMPFKIRRLARARTRTMAHRVAKVDSSSRVLAYPVRFSLAFITNLASRPA